MSYFSKKNLFSNYDDDEKYFKVQGHCHNTGKYRSAAHNFCNLRYKAPKDIPVIFYSSFNFVYQELEGNFECLS